MDIPSTAEILREAAERARRGEPYAMATVVWARPPTSCKPGDRALVTAEGELHGWIGGGCSEGAVVRHCRLAMRERVPRLLHLGPADELPDPRPGRVVEPIGCASEGALEVFVEPHLPRPRLIVIGDAPAAGALVRMAGELEFDVRAIEDGARERVSSVIGDAGTARERYVVVATMGRSDEPALRAALESAVPYIALIASRKRARAVLDALRAAGIEDAELSRIRAPAGLDLGRIENREIAVAVLAEIVQLRAGSRPIRAERAAGVAAESAAAEREGGVAIDPVCGMTVDPASAPSSAEHEGRTVYFCCAGCRDRFLREPPRQGSGRPDHASRKE